MKRKIITGGNWWDKLGKPEYGGEIIIRADRNIEFRNLANIDSAWLEKLHTDDWTLNPAVFDYKMCWRPPQFLKGQLAESWEFTAPGICVVHLRLCGLGGGFSKPSQQSSAPLEELMSVTAVDQYTVVFKWKTTNPEFIMETLFGVDSALWLENPDAIKEWGNIIG